MALSINDLSKVGRVQPFIFKHLPLGSINMQTFAPMVLTQLSLDAQGKNFFVFTRLSVTISEI